MESLRSGENRMKLELEVKDEVKEKIVANELKEIADMCAEEITDLLEELESSGLQQYKLKDLNDSATNLKAILTVLRYCTVNSNMIDHENLLADYYTSIGSYYEY